MNNYEMLQFLIGDGGWYTAVGHFDLLKSQFPEITENHIKSLRSAIQRSPRWSPKANSPKVKRPSRLSLLTQVTSPTPGQTADHAGENHRQLYPQ